MSVLEVLIQGDPRLELVSFKGWDGQPRQILKCSGCRLTRYVVGRMCGGVPPSDYAQTALAMMTRHVVEGRCHHSGRLPCELIEYQVNALEETASVCRLAAFLARHQAARDHMAERVAWHRAQRGVGVRALYWERREQAAITWWPDQQAQALARWEGREHGVRTRGRGRVFQPVAELPEPEGPPESDLVLQRWRSISGRGRTARRGTLPTETADQAPEGEHAEGNPGVSQGPAQGAGLRPQARDRQQGD